MTTESQLTLEDIRLFNYFYNDKGDLTKWSDWKRLKPIFRKEHPLLMGMIEDQELRETTIRTLIENMVEQRECDEIANDQDD